MATIAVLGPGGVGGFIAGALSRAGEDVTVVARESTAQHLSRDGIHVESVRLGRFSASPRVVATLSDPADVLFIATKAMALDAALERIETVPLLVVPLLNGLDHMRRLRERFAPELVAAGTIRIEADRPERGRIVHTSQFLRVDLATRYAESQPALERTAAMLQAAEVPARIGTSEPQILWSKLVRLNALALTTSASGRRIGFIRSDPQWSATLDRCLQEGAAVGRADGAEIEPSAPRQELDEAHAELGSSMQRDIAAGREPELDAIAGSVLRAGARHGVDCPTIERLAGEVARRAGVEAPRTAA
jgi:2-dehydropantoate 2-reductase